MGKGKKYNLQNKHIRKGFVNPTDAANIKFMQQQDFKKICELSGYYERFKII